MNKTHAMKKVVAAATQQHQHQALVDRALKLPGVEEAFAVYNQAVKSLPSNQSTYGFCYSTDVNSASAS